MNRAVIGVGSNIDPYSNIDKAARLLGQTVKVLQKSALVQTKPIGIIDQPDFVNGAFLIETEYQQGVLKDFLFRVEEKLGRTRAVDKFGPRTIDLDIIVWNGTIVDKDFYARDFLRQAVLTLWPDLKI